MLSCAGDSPYRPAVARQTDRHSLDTNPRDMQCHRDWSVNAPSRPGTTSQALQRVYSVLYYRVCVCVCVCVCGE